MICQRGSHSLFPAAQQESKELDLLKKKSTLCTNVLMRLNLPSDIEASAARYILATIEIFQLVRKMQIDVLSSEAKSDSGKNSEIATEILRRLSEDPALVTTNILMNALKKCKYEFAAERLPLVIPLGGYLITERKFTAEQVLHVNKVGCYYRPNPYFNLMASGHITPSNLDYVLKFFPSPYEIQKLSFFITNNLFTWEEAYTHRERLGAIPTGAYPRILDGCIVKERLLSDSKETMALISEFARKVTKAEKINELVELGIITRSEKLEDDHLEKLYRSGHKLVACKLMDKEAVKNYSHNQLHRLRDLYPFIQHENKSIADILAMHDDVASKLTTFSILREIGLSSAYILSASTDLLDKIKHGIEFIKNNIITIDDVVSLPEELSCLLQNEIKDLIMAGKFSYQDYLGFSNQKKGYIMSLSDLIMKDLVTVDELHIMNDMSLNILSEINKTLFWEKIVAAKRTVEPLATVAKMP